jgi:hypothetical protein
MRRSVAYNDYLHGQHGECVSDKDFEIDEHAPEPEDDAKLPTGIFEDDVAHRIPDRQKIGTIT